MANVVSILGTVGGPNIHRVPIAWLGTAFYYAFICFVIFATAAALFDSDRKPAAKCGCMAMAFFFAGTIILAIYVGRNRENTSDEVVRDSIIFIVLGTIASLVGNVLFHAFDKSPPKPYSSRLPTRRTATQIILAHLLMMFLNLTITMMMTLTNPMRQ